MKDFFKIKFADFVSVVLGLAGLLLTGGVAVNVAPDTTQLALAAVGIAVFGASLYVFARSNEKRKYPFNIRRQSTTIRFKRVNGEICGTVSRVARMRWRRHSPDHYERWQMVTEPSALTVAEIASRMELQARIKVLRKRKDFESPYSVEPTIETEESRRVNITYPVPAFTRALRKFEIEETFKLPNPYRKPTESYGVHIVEPVKRRHVRIEAEDIRITHATAAVVLGSRQLAPEILRVQQEGAVWAFERTYKDLPVGAVIRLEWQWEV